MKLAPFETPFTLSDGDRRAMQRLAKRCVHETLLDYEHVLARKNGQPNTTRWKPVKRKSNIVVYQDRLALEEVRQRKRKARSLGDIVDTRRMGDLLSRREVPRSFHSVTNIEIDENEAVELPKMTWMGTVECELDDLMYGIVSQSDEVTRINSSYSGNDIQDFATLASLETSTPSDPFHGLQLKWEVNSALTKAKPVWHHRDFVYLEATGITTSSAAGQRIGYQILHSLDMRNAPELTQCKLIRGKVTIYQVFRQKSKGTVEVFAKAMVDLGGNVPASMGSFATIEAANSVNIAAGCARKRKLNWLLTTVESNSANFVANDCHDSCCNMCSREFRKAFGKWSFYSCHICTKWVCHRCHVRQKLSFLKPDNNSCTVIQKTLDLCTRCVHTASQMNARRVALEERVLGDAASMYKYIPREMKPSLEASLEDSMAFEHLVSTRGAINGVECFQQTILLDEAMQELHELKQDLQL